MKEEKYIYRNAPIPGGGYVTGLMYAEGSLYARTDIGGTYRFDDKEKQWRSLIDHVQMSDLRETFPIAIAKDSGKLYIISGIWERPDAKLSITADDGKTWKHFDLPFRAHGNLNGRGTGTKLIADRGKLYFASQAQGLFRSTDDGRTWECLDALPEKYLTFVAVINKDIIVGSAGVSCMKDEIMRGPALYISHDSGETFEALKQPENIRIDEMPLSGYVASRYFADDRYLYVTFQLMGINAWNRDFGYSCDGGSVWGGRIFRYTLEGYECTDITPPQPGTAGVNPMDSGGTSGEKEKIIEKRGLDILPYGFGGIAGCINRPGLLAAATLSSEAGDCIFRSMDYGETWQVILYDLEIGVMDFRTEYMKPEYNGGHNLIHWLSDLKINPDDANELWFNTGTGPFCTHNLLDGEVHFSDWPDGIEETVHINCYSLPAGEGQLLDIVGDLGGFVFAKLDKPCTNSFADENGNRYITCLNADFSDRDPSKIIVTARGNWTGLTKGGLIYSHDQGRSFKHIDHPMGLSAKMDKLLERIMKPNVNSGWAALSPNGENIVWTVGDGVFLPADSVVVSHDGGDTFTKANIYDTRGNLISEDVPMADEIPDLISGSDKAPGFKVFSDRVNDNVFYGFGQSGEFYVSTDAGCSFRQIMLTDTADGTCLDSVCGVNFSLVDTINKTEIRAAGGESGLFYMALAGKGMAKLKADVSDETVKVYFTKLTGDKDIVYRLGLGLGREGGDYMSESKAIYIAASINGEYGFYRTCDEGKSFVRLNTADQMYGDINSISGDARTYGRFYIATGSRGILYGEPVCLGK